MPTFRRSFQTSLRRIRSEEKPLTRTSPEVGRSAMWMRRRVVDFPEPEWPVRKANSPFRMWKVTSRRAGPRLGYSFVTSVSLITR